LRDTLLLILAQRRLDLAPEQRSAIAACTAPERLRQWLLRAVDATSAAEVFGQLPD
jgi:hypothetical protein